MVLLSPIRLGVAVADVRDAARISESAVITYDGARGWPQRAYT